MRILFLTHRLPYAPNRGDRVRAYHLLREMSRWAAVDLLSLVHDDEEASQADAVRAFAVSVHAVRVKRGRNIARTLLSLPTARPATHTMLDGPGLAGAIGDIVSRHRPDVVLAYCSGMARLALDPPLADIPLVLDMVDVDSAKWADLSAGASFPRSWVYAREARLLARFEARAARHARTNLVVTERERQSLLALAPDARIEVVPNGVDVDGLRPEGPPAADPSVVFCGVMNYPPNVVAARWLAREIWPQVRARRPDARLQLVGSSPSRTVRDLASSADGIEVTGGVPDVRPFLWNAAVAAAPLRTARGVQNKVLEAVAAGLPVVTTPVVMSGLPEEIRTACLADGTTAGFAAAVVNLLDQSPAARRERARRAGLESLSWEARLAPLEGILRAAASVPDLPGRPA